jgi:protein-S-isoprenylcysteine O-methyltransferase Ste14
MDLRSLVGSGEKIALFTLPFAVVGVILNLALPELVEVGGPPEGLRAASIVILIPGVAVWLWSAMLILTKVPRGELITDGPYAWVKHPLYTGVAFLVLPWAGFLLDTWLGAAIGIVLYVAARRYAPEEESSLAERFGARWEHYAGDVKLAWL